MFPALAKFAAKYKVAILIFWLAAAISLFIFAPALTKVGVTDDAQFLPRDAESTQAQQLLDEKFATPLRQSPGSATIVAYDPAGLSAAGQSEIQRLADWLISPQAPAEVSRVVSASSMAGVKSPLTSQDGTTQLINLELSVASSSAPARDAVKDIRAFIQAQSYRTQIFVTGNAGVSYDLLTSIQNTIDKATLVTVLLVFVLLLLIYRSPVAILVPLLTIGLSYLTSRGLAGYIAASGVNISSLADAYLVVTLFGIGTDYCLFMVSRFKEEMQKADRLPAGEETLKRIGPVILASATTVMVALLCLGVSQFGMNRTSGFILALGVAVTLLAGLTLTPALIFLFGRNLLWPARIKQVKRSSPGLWEKVGTFITRHPLALAVPLVIVLALPYIALPGMKITADVQQQMPRNDDSIKGLDVLRQHFPAGQLGPIYVLVQVPAGAASQPATVQQTALLGQRIAQLPGVSAVHYATAPAGLIDSLAQGVRQAVQSAAGGNLTALNDLRSLPAALQDLAVNYPGIVQSANFTSASSALGQISVLSARLMAGDGSVLPAMLQLGGQMADALTGLSTEFALQVDTPFTDSLRATYFSTDASLVKLQVILAEDPYSNEAVTTLKAIREVLPNSLNGSFNLAQKSYVGGITAVQSDIISVNDSDFLRVLLLAIVGILLVTVLLIRSLVAPLYMIATVLFNYGATLGIASWIFLDVLKQNSEIYMLPIFVFVMLVAVGSDYNIFLVSRIREENRRLPLRDAICAAISNTGGVITSCGIILAGTFATLTTAPLQLVFQVGAAIGLGVLVDTFLVRAILIPCLASLVGKWNWWPSRTPG